MQYPRISKSPIQDYLYFVIHFSRSAKLYLIASMFVAISIAILNVIYNLYLISLGYDAGVIGKTATAVAIGVALMGIPAGVFYDRVSSKASFIFSVLGMTCTIFLRAFSTSQTMILGWAFLNGVFNAFYFVAIFPFLTNQSTPAERAHLFGANMMIWTTFTMVGSLTGGFLPDLFQTIFPHLSETLSLRYCIVVAAILNLIALLPLCSLPSLSSTKRSSTSRYFVPSVASRSAILAGAIVLALTGLVIGLTIPFMNIYFKNTFSSSTRVIGLIYSLSQLMGLFSAIIGPMAIKSFGLIRASVFLMLLNAPIIFTIGLPFPFLIIVIAFLLSVGFERMADLGLMNLIMEAVHPTDRGSMSGVRLITNYGAQALAGIIGGTLILSAGYSWLFAIAACIEIVAGLLVWVLFKSRISFPEKVTS